MPVPRGSNRIRRLNDASLLEHPLFVGALPEQLEVAEPARDEEQIDRPVADDLIGDVHVTGLRVLRLGLRHVHAFVANGSFVLMPSNFRMSLIPRPDLGDAMLAHQCDEVRVRHEVAPDDDFGRRCAPRLPEALVLGPRSDVRPSAAATTTLAFSDIRVERVLEDPRVASRSAGTTSPSARRCRRGRVRPTTSSEEVACAFVLLARSVGGVQQDVGIDRSSSTLVEQARRRRPCPRGRRGPSSGASST